MHRAKITMKKKLARRLHDRGEWAIRVDREKLAWGKGLGTWLALELAHKRSDGIRPDDVDTLLESNVAGRSHRHENCVDMLSAVLGVAATVVAAKVSRIGGSLIDVGLSRIASSLQLEHDYGAARQ